MCQDNFKFLQPAILTPLRDTCINCTLFLMILQSNSLDECFNQDEYLGTYVYAYNTSVHDSTTFSPFEVMLGRKAILPIDINIDEKEPDMMLMNQEEPAIAEFIDVMSEQCLKVLEFVKQSIQQAQIKQKQAYDKKHASKHSFEVGYFRRGKRAGHTFCRPVHYCHVSWQGAILSSISQQCC